MGEAYDLNGSHDRRIHQVVMASEPINVLALMHTVRVSGPARGLYQLIERSKDLGVRYVLGMFLAPSLATCPAIEEAVGRGIHVATLPEYSKYDPLVILKTWRVVCKNQIQVLQSHGYRAAFVSWCLRNITGLPWIAFAHGYTYENRRMLLYNRIDLWLMTRADLVVAVSDATSDLLRRAGVRPERIRVIRNAVNAQDHRLNASGQEFRRFCGFTDAHVVAGVIGRFSQEKGQRVFLESFRRVRASVPNARAVLIGEGPDEEALQEFIAGTGLSGFVTVVPYQADIAPVYMALDLVVIPSYSEGLPNVLLEAMTFGKPAVATQVGGIPEVMQERFPETLVPPGDASALATVITRLLQDRSLRQRLGNAGASYVQEHFNPMTRAKHIVELYREVLGRWPLQEEKQAS